MIDVIIPAYNSYNTIDTPLLSLAGQSIAKKLNVFIINDGSDKSYIEYVKFYKKFFNSMKELKLRKNKGSGYARRHGLNNTNSEFIFFIDSDDCLYYPYAIEELLNEIVNKNFDVVASNVLEEYDNGYGIKEHPEEYLHGKLYRRSYIKEHNINFDDSRLMEDIVFNKTILLQNPKIGYLDFVTYVWKNNENSLTRKENFIFETIGIYIKNNLNAIKSALKGSPNKEKIGECIYESIIYFYLCYISSPEKKYFIENFNTFNELVDLSSKFPISKSKKENIFETDFNEMVNYYGINVSIFNENKTSLEELIEISKKDC